MATTVTHTDTVLVVEDKDSLRAMLRVALEQQGYRVCEARDMPEATAVLARESIDLVLSDLRLPIGDGLEVLRATKAVDPDVPVIVMTAYGGIEEAVRAMRDGALDFLSKPVDPDHLSLMIARALQQRRLITENHLLKEALATNRGVPQIVGEADAMQKALTSVRKAAMSDATVLLEGESGTGKELFARALHALSPRASGPFVAINCAAIPETLLETELFGHEKGAFTGAVARKLGKFEVAHKGTLFLDEVGDLPLGLQPKILRALESRQFERVGANASTHVNVRVVAATNRRLRQEVASKRFRDDLFFRLSVFPITVPPLRERATDIPILAQYFVDRFCREQGLPPRTLAPSAVDALEKYHWPGNVRELRNCLERAVILTDSGPIQPQHLNFAIVPAVEVPAIDPWDHVDLDGSLPEVTRRIVAEVERRKIRQALVECSGEVSKAAELLRLPYRVLLGKMREHGLGTERLEPSSSVPVRGAGGFG